MRLKAGGQERRIQRSFLIPGRISSATYPQIKVRPWKDVANKWMRLFAYWEKPIALTLRPVSVCVNIEKTILYVCRLAKLFFSHRTADKNLFLFI